MCAVVNDRLDCSIICLHVFTFVLLFYELLKLTGPPPDVPVRLVGGPSSSSGRVEVYRDGQWATVCDDHWDMTSAAVVCKQLGFSGVLSTEGTTEYVQGEGPILSEIDCEGMESTVEECQWGLWDTLACSHIEDVGITCQTGILIFILYNSNTDSCHLIGGEHITCHWIPKFDVTSAYHFYFIYVFSTLSSRNYPIW